MRAHTHTHTHTHRFSCFIGTSLRHNGFQTVFTYPNPTPKSTPHTKLSDIFKKLNSVWFISLVLVGNKKMSTQSQKWLVLWSLWGHDMGNTRCRLHTHTHTHTHTHREREFSQPLEGHNPLVFINRSCLLLSSKGLLLLQWLVGGGMLYMDLESMDSKVINYNGFSKIHSVLF